MIRIPLQLRGLSDGVMVTQRPLEALFMVRVHVGQPTFPFLIFDWPRVLALHQFEDSAL